ncbi:LysR substrate-binding domain-containing protein [Niveibacterium sp. 24ML]|uniref:LysR family transcriptional regulator n=1 Tax=Niveibacterium sp. 24ML TaxID=2985512 RepID=UPI00227159FD|nr:LysR substrate-binding domain-containing protein [Niveibacterium sp. 24ML]MCX9157577.1 LysR substrate-binding domain-containing protein [Niveibacterium sp. 24ML]
MLRSLLPHLPGFAAVARHGSFSRAAEELALTQAGVSYQIRQLEDRLGFALFLRGPGQPLRLTERGALLLEEYRLAEKSIERTLDMIRIVGERQRIRVTAPVDLGSCYITPRLPQIEAHGLIVDLHLSDQPVALADSRFDLAVRNHPDEARLVHEPLLTSASLLVCSRSYASAHGTPDTVATLASHRILLRNAERSHSWSDLLAAAGMELGSLTDTRVLGNSFALLEGVRAGLGVALLPRYLVAEQIALGRLVELNLRDGAPAPTAFYLSYYPSVTARLWAATLRDCLAASNAV